MIFISFIIIILLVYFLIIRPLTQRNNQPPYDDRRGYYNDRRVPFDDRRGYYDRPDYYGPPPVNTGMGRFGTFAGGIAAGALLTYLFEQGRVGFDQYQEWRGLGDQDIMRELMDQNILQDHEIAQLQDDMDLRREDQWDRDDIGNDPDDHDYDDQNNGQDNIGFDQNNNNDDNWV